MSENQNEQANESQPPDDNKLMPANTAADGQTSGPDREPEDKVRVSTKHEILFKLDSMPGLIATGLLPAARANSMRAIFQTMLANLDDSSSAGAAVIANEDLVAVLRGQPDLLKVLKPFLTPDQLALIVREATND